MKNYIILGLLLLCGLNAIPISSIANPKPREIATLSANDNPPPVFRLDRYSFGEKNIPITANRIQDKKPISKNEAFSYHS